MKKEEKESGVSKLVEAEYEGPSPPRGESEWVCEKYWVNERERERERERGMSAVTANPQREVEEGEADPVEDVEGFQRCVDQIFSHVIQLEQRVNEAENLCINKDNTYSKCHLFPKDKQLPTIDIHNASHNHREAAAAKRMQDLMRHFLAIFRQIIQHKWAWPFMQPVDVEGLGLHDYFEIIEKPMDFSTIKKKMEAKDGTGYKNVREIYADVRLVFKNAMKYNDEREDVHVMAKTLLEKFEEKWLQLLPKVAEEEKRQADEEAKTQLDMQLAQEAAHANMARDLSNELYDVDMQLKKLREMVIQKCRKMSTEEKKKLGVAFTRLCPEDLNKALEIVAESNPAFQADAQEVDLDMDAQSEITLWRLKVFVQEALKISGNSCVISGGIGVNSNNNKNNSKRKREICDALTKTAVKRTKKVSSNI
ncbi:Bromodomain domain-containing protein [Cephalotus follicularis]|uniref:Bromodomain domain-containing protein n=1 Tax=Cephalotus follicularis TaxID=3775 RepID=A0A1Q3CIQ6_CEPFO|nr:Bromodomain domain-containing protein [Cephalotus follicularis]